MQARQDYQQKNFTTFLDNIYLFASETLGIILPKPDDIWF